MIPVEMPKCFWKHAQHVQNLRIACTIAWNKTGKSDEFKFWKAVLQKRQCSSVGSYDHPMSVFLQVFDDGNQPAGMPQTPVKRTN